MSRNRKTRQRDVISRIVEQTRRPLTAKEILSAGRLDVPTLGLRTVYRQISRLVDEGKLVSLDFPGHPTRFETVRGRSHPHFICNRCRQVFDFERAASSPAYQAPPGFSIDGTEIVFYGICPDCSNRSG